MAFSLNEKGELYAAIETTYGTTPAASTLGTSDVQNLRKLSVRAVPDKLNTEDAGGGLIAGVEGLANLQTGYQTLYEGDSWLREFVVPATDTGDRPLIDKWLRAGGWNEGTYDLGSRTVTYNMAYHNGAQPGLVMRYREYQSDGGRKLHDVQGARHSSRLKLVAGQGLMLEMYDGKAISYDDTGSVAAALAPPSMNLGRSESVIPYLNATQTLLQIGGGTFPGKIVEVTYDVPQRTVLLKDPSAASGYCEAFQNPSSPGLTLKLYERDDTLSIREAWRVANAHFDLSWSISGPANAGGLTNTVSSRVYFDLTDVTEEAGENGIMMLTCSCKPLFADRSAHTAVGIDPSEQPFQLVWTTA